MPIFFFHKRNLRKLNIFYTSIIKWEEAVHKLAYRMKYEHSCLKMKTMEIITHKTIKWISRNKKNQSTAFKKIHVVLVQYKLIIILTSLTSCINTTACPNSGGSSFNFSWNASQNALCTTSFTFFSKLIK